MTDLVALNLTDARRIASEELVRRLRVEQDCISQDQGDLIREAADALEVSEAELALLKSVEGAARELDRHADWDDGTHFFTEKARCLQRALAAYDAAKASKPG